MVIGHRLVALMIRRVPVLTFRVDFLSLFSVSFFDTFFTFLEKALKGHFRYIYIEQTAPLGQYSGPDENVLKNDPKS